MHALCRKKIHIGAFCHYKVGLLYRVLKVAYHSETLDLLVLYQHANGKNLLIPTAQVVFLKKY